MPAIILFAETQESQGFSITTPMDFQWQHLTGQKCLALTWRGVCANNTCMAKIKTTLSRKSLYSMASMSSETQPFHPFQIPNTTSQAQCYFDYGGENATCCDKIISGLKTTGQAIDFGNWDWIKIKFSRYHISDNSSHISKETHNYVLPCK